MIFWTKLQFIWHYLHLNESNFPLNLILTKLDSMETYIKSFNTLKQCFSIGSTRTSKWYAKKSLSVRKNFLKIIEKQFLTILEKKKTKLKQKTVKTLINFNEISQNCDKYLRLLKSYFFEVIELRISNNLSILEINFEDFK